MIELYHCADGRSLRCLWALEEMGLPYRLHLLPFPPRLFAPEYLALNPLGTIPFLIDGETRMTESAAILVYLTTKYGPTPLRVEAQEPDYGSWLNWLHAGEATLTTPQAVALRYTRFAAEENQRPDIAETHAQVFLDNLSAVDAALSSREYLCGDRFTAADISVAYAILLSTYIGAFERIPPRVADYWARLRQRPAYQAAVTAQAAPTNWPQAAV